MLLPTTKTVKFESHDLCIALQPKLNENSTLLCNLQRFTRISYTRDRVGSDPRNSQRYKAQYWRDKHSSAFEFQLIDKRRSYAQFV